MQVPNMPGGGAGRIRTRGVSPTTHTLLNRPVLPVSPGCPWVSRSHRATVFPCASGVSCRSRL